MIQGTYAGKRPKRIVIHGWLSYSEAGKALGLGVETIRLYVWRGVLERGYFHDMPLISKASVENYQRKRMPPGNPMFTKKKKRPRLTEGERQQAFMERKERRAKLAEKKAALIAKLKQERAKQG